MNHSSRPERIVFIGCTNYTPEFDNLRPDDSRIEYVQIPCICDIGPAGEPELERVLSAYEGERILSFCTHVRKRLPHSAGDFTGNSGVRRKFHCLDVLAPPELLMELTREGSYLVSPGWVKLWREKLTSFGFDRERAREFFRETVANVCLLDTLVEEESRKHLEEFCAYVGLPWKIVPVGIEPFMNRIELMILRGRVEEVQEESRREISDYAMTLDLLGTIVRSGSIDAVVEQIIELCTTLTGARTILFLPDAMVPFTKASYGIPDADPPDEDTVSRIRDEIDDHTFGKTGHGFFLHIADNGNDYGSLVIEDVPFAEYMDTYLNILQTIGGVFALAFSNSLAFMNLENVTRQLEQQAERLKQTVDEKNILLREVYHRVKNNLQLVTNLLELQAMRVDEDRIRQMFRQSIRRIHSMTLVHTRLYQSDNLAKIDFHEYLADIVASFQRIGEQGKEIDFRTEVGEIELDLEKAIPCGLIINELVTNAMKYAFPDRNAGVVSIELRRESGGDVLLRVSDDGIGLPANMTANASGSLGMTLVTTLTSQLQGTVEMENDNGAVFTIVFPASDPTSTD